MSVPFEESRDAVAVLDKIKAVVDKGVEKRYFQRTPHLVLLSRSFYSRELKPLLAEWIAIFLAFQVG